MGLRHPITPLLRLGDGILHGVENSLICPEFSFLNTSIHREISIEPPLSI